MIVTAILARNEADKDLPAVIRNAFQHSDEVLVLDDGSTDCTPGVALDLGCKLRKRKSPKGMWGNETPARKELWDWGASVAKDGWLLVQDADMILVGDPRPLTQSTVCNAWAWVLYDCWSPTTYRQDGYWQGHTVPRPWMVCPSRVPDGWTPQWPGKGLHTGHIPPNFPIVATATTDLYWLHMAYSSEERRVAKWRQYLSKAHLLSEFEYAHADSILPPIIQPVGKRVLVQLLPDDNPSDFLHVVTSPTLTRKANVLAVGEQVPDLLVGQTVLCRPLTGMEIGDNHLLPTAGVLAVIA